MIRQLGTIPLFATTQEPNEAAELAIASIERFGDLVKAVSEAILARNELRAVMDEIGVRVVESIDQYLLVLTAEREAL